MLFTFGCSSEIQEEQRQYDEIISKRKSLTTSNRSSQDTNIGPDCLEANIVSIPGCNDIKFTEILEITNLPGYPGCTFEIEYDYYICALGTLLDFSIGDYEIVNHDCDEFSDDLANVLNNVIWSDFHGSLDQAIYDIVENHFIEENLDDNEYICGSGLLFQISFFASSCFQSCITRETQNGGQQAYIVKQACGAECCESHTRVCQDEDGNIFKEVDIVTDFNADCSDDNYQFYVNCLSDEEAQSVPCIFRCLEN